MSKTKIYRVPVSAYFTAYARIEATSKREAADIVDKMGQEIGPDVRKVMEGEGLTEVLGEPQTMNRSLIKIL